MDAGRVVGGRFEIERSIGAGGMGVVYAARDRAGGARVALKLQTLGGDGSARARFLREARTLAEINHPAVVRYVAHGVDEDGPAWLAMEWLEGEDLAGRLARGRLAAPEAIALVRRVADGLAAVHAHGLVHRDLKPANLFLAGGEPARVVLIDFGVVRHAAASVVLTRPGSILGTVAYLAPEQARAHDDVDARADLYALGCVLYECLTGAPVWAGDHPVAVLSNILLGEPPRLAEARPDLPAALDALVTVLLARDRSERPPDAGAVVRALDALGALPAEAAGAPRMSAPSPATAGPRTITATEQRLTAVIVIAPEDARALPDSIAATIAADATAVTDAVGAVVARYGGRVEVLAGGARVILVGGGSGFDQAARAARCALDLRGVASGRIALAMGRAVVSGRVPVGEVVHRALGLAPAESDGSVRIDELTRSLLEGRFDLTETDGHAVLGAERGATGESVIRRVHGRVVPCVGRDREIEDLVSLFEQCASEPVARAVLITGPSGMGKSRLASEALARVAGGEPTPRVLWARGDALRTGSPLGIASQLVASALGLRATDDAAARPRRVRTRAADLGLGSRVAAFLAELIDAPAPETADDLLALARRSPETMHDQIRTAWLEWLRAEVGEGPVVLAIEDLQWADQPSVRLIDTALDVLGQRPLLVLAMARPEVQDVFVDLWRGRDLHLLRLGRLTRRAAEALVRAALGDVPPEQVAAIVERADGNAFVLEELARARISGSGSASLPDTVLAVAQARLESFAPEERRVLRAASTFGETFWAGGVSALTAMPRARVSEHLEALVEAEVLVRRAGARFAGESDFAFRHLLLREAVAATFVEDDRRTAHRLAAEWLQSIGEGDAGVLANHYAAAGAHERELGWRIRAADEALRVDDFVAARREVEAADVAAGQPDVREEPRLAGERACVAAETAAGLAEWAAAYGHALEAMQKLGPEHAWFDRAARVAVIVSQQVGGLPGWEDVYRTMRERVRTGAGGAAAVREALLATTAVMLASEPSSAVEGLGEIEAAAEKFLGDPILAAHRARARLLEKVHQGGLAAEAYPEALATAEACERAGMVGRALNARANAAALLAVSGKHARAAEDLETLVALAKRTGARHMVAFLETHLGLAVARSGDRDRARVLFRRSEEAFAESPRGLVLTRIFSTLVELEAGDVAAAVAAARSILAVDRVKPSLVALGQALLGRTLLAAGRADEALAVAQLGFETLARLGKVEEGEPLIRLAHAEALHATGSIAQARREIAVAAERLRAAAARVAAHDTDLGRAVLEDVPEHARTLALASAWTA